MYGNPKKTITFFVHPSGANATNVRYLVNGAIEAGFSVEIAEVNSLKVNQSRKVNAQVTHISQPLTEECDLKQLPFEEKELRSDMVWLLNHGSRSTYWDMLSILIQVEDNLRVPVVNSPRSHLKYHNKVALLMHENIQQPETWVDKDPQRLLEVIRNNPDDYFVLKPFSGSRSQGVHKLCATTPDLEDVLARSVRDEGGFPKQVVLQRGIPDIDVKGEKRVIVAGGKVVGVFKKSLNGVHRGEGQAVAPEACTLDHEERRLCTRLAKELLKDGCYFSGIDLCYPYVIEVNVVHPGGLATIHKLTGENCASDVVVSVFQAAEKNQSRVSSKPFL